MTYQEARVYDEEGNWMLSMPTKQKAWEIMDEAGYVGKYYVSVNSGARELFYDARHAPAFFRCTSVGE